MLAIPPALLDILHLEVGMTVGVAVDGERLTIQPQVKPSYTLDELLAQCDPAAPISDEERAWLDITPVGQEL